jgi:hypothetical protein
MDEKRASYDMGISDIVRYLAVTYLVWDSNGEQTQIENESLLLKN